MDAELCGDAAAPRSNQFYDDPWANHVRSGTSLKPSPSASTNAGSFTVVSVIGLRLSAPAVCLLLLYHVSSVERSVADAGATH
jgi:hypothetical protein